VTPGRPVPGPLGTRTAALAEAVRVTKRHGATVALRDVSLAVAPRASHALVGRNGAGKSTLVRILTGLSKPDSGEVRFGGQPAPDVAQRERWRGLVACVYQKSTVIGELTVAENLFLNAQPGPARHGVSWPALRREARRLLAEWQLDIDVRAPAGRLGVGQRQLLEIAHALHQGSRLIVLDEPTARLEGREIAQLFGHMHRLQASGVTFLYISHHLEEIYEVCAEVTVLRDGQVVTTAPVAQLRRETLVHAMVGDSAAPGPAVRSGARPSEVDSLAALERAPGARLEVRRLTVPGWCHEVSFEIGPGERVGLAGLAGSGKAQVADAIVGMIRPGAGEVLLDGAPLPAGRVDLAIERGIGYVPEDRHARGFAPDLTVAENLTTTVLPRLGRWGVVSARRRGGLAVRLIGSLEIVASSLRQPTGELSGGNQQKTVMGRALASEPRLLVLVHPTAGVDIAAKDALYHRIRASPATVLLVSDELDELDLCDRVLVMFDGRLSADFGRRRSQRELVEAMEGLRR
jgi:simple sugar transport system ATP-binding protein